MAIGGVMWVEKHRPRELGEIAGQGDIVGSLEALAARPEEAIRARLAHIAKKEGAKAAAGGIDAILEASGGDLRHAVNMLQVAASLPGGITAENARAAAGLTAESRLDEVLRLALAGKVSQARERTIEMLRVNGLSGADILRGINAAVNRAAPERAEELVRAISEYDYRILVGASPEIQLSAMLYELGAIAGKK